MRTTWWIFASSTVVLTPTGSLTLWMYSPGLYPSLARKVINNLARLLPRPGSKIWDFCVYSWPLKLGNRKKNFWLPSNGSMYKTKKSPFCKVNGTQSFNNNQASILNFQSSSSRIIFFNVWLNFEIIPYKHKY